MEKIIEYLITISIVAAVLLCLVVFAVLIHYFRTRAMALKLLRRGKRSGDFIYDLLKTSFQTGRIFKHITLPAQLPDGTKTRVPADLILIDRGGVFVIRVRHLSGAVDNTDPRVWLVRNAAGTTEIANPFEQNRPALHAVERILRRENVYNVPLYNLVVFSGKKVSFLSRSEKLLTSDRLLETIRDMNRNKFLNQKEISAAVTAIDKYLPPKRPNRKTK
ncbi:MAG: NERD domain-containing protein [Ruminococcaceae bacterium]|nr:NERD domain-containing protein [Oscillospiraceae bacterium]